MAQQGACPQGGSLFVLCETLKDRVDMLLSCFPHLFISMIMILLTTLLPSTSLLASEMHLKYSPGFCAALFFFCFQTKVCGEQGLFRAHEKSPVAETVGVSQSENLVQTTTALVGKA